MAGIRAGSGPRSGRPRGVIQYWWALCAAGAVVLGVGIAIHSSPLEYGGPISIGVLLLLGGVVCAVRMRRGDIS